jgi:hypothetical protein
VSTHNAAMYARRARDAPTHSEVGDNVNRAVTALIDTIAELEKRMRRLEVQLAGRQDRTEKSHGTGRGPPRSPQAL